MEVPDGGVHFLELAVQLVDFLSENVPFSLVVGFLPGLFQFFQLVLEGIIGAFNVLCLVLVGPHDLIKVFHVLLELLLRLIVLLGTLFKVEEFVPEVADFLLQAPDGTQGIASVNLYGFLYNI